MNIKKWISSGEPYIWLNAGAVSLSIIMVAGLVGLIAVRGLGHYWPQQVVSFEYNDGSAITVLIGEVVDEEKLPLSQLDTEQEISADADGLIKRFLLKTGNRDYLGLDFRWVLEADMGSIDTPAEVMVVERREWGNLYGFLKEIKEDGKTLAAAEEQWLQFQEKIKEAGETFDQIRHIEKDLIGAINYKMERLRLKQRGLELKGKATDLALKEISSERAGLQLEYEGYTQELSELYTELNRSSFVASLASGEIVEIPTAKVIRAHRPNTMSRVDKLFFYFEKLWEFMSAEPREANTEGGIFPAIFGTVMMVMIMAVLVTPFGVIAAVYLREYATQGPVTRLIRIAVNNLAGVPSVVYGVFGLGFFVYFLGGSIDQLLFPEALPTPTFGTPGLMWASLTLAILTVPVVIVATEEGLSRVPRSIREGSLALGATKAETLWLTVLPMTASAMMTGLILAVARAAGEVAPLMLVGVVKLAPSLPLDGNFPYLHMDRKFMHLGFHIYDVGFQSPNVEAARPLVYATALLLILIIIALNLTAVKIRNNLREKNTVQQSNTSQIMDRNPSMSDTIEEQLNDAESSAAKTHAIDMSSLTRSSSHLSLEKEQTCITVEDFNLYYAEKQALENINLTIPEKRVTAFIGPSGCGKSTLLRCMNRMNDLIDIVRIDGKMSLYDHDIYAKDINVAELRRRVGMVFQKPNPFPKSIFENVAYGLRIQGVKDRRVLAEAVEKSLQGAALWDEVKDRLDDNAMGLSGGQQQRLVIARAIAIEPEVLLLDEPASALDPISTLKIEELIYELRHDYTIVIVTHNMQQAARVSDYTAYMYLGKMVEFNDTNTLFTTPGEKMTEDYITGRYG